MKIILDQKLNGKEVQFIQFVHRCPYVSKSSNEAVQEYFKYMDGFKAIEGKDWFVNPYHLGNKKHQIVSKCTIFDKVTSRINFFARMKDGTLYNCAPHTKIRSIQNISINGSTVVIDGIKQTPSSIRCLARFEGFESVKDLLDNYNNDQQAKKLIIWSEGKYNDNYKQK